MTTILLQILGIVGYTVILLLCGTALGFVYYGRARWTNYLDRWIPPKTPEYLEAMLDEMVQERKLTVAQKLDLTNRLWTDKMREDRRANYEAEQEEAMVTRGHSAFEAAADKLKRELGV